MHQPISSVCVGSSHGHQLVSGTRWTLSISSTCAVAGLAVDARLRCARWCWNCTCSGRRWICTHSIGRLLLPVLLQGRGCPRARRSSAGTGRGSPCTARPTARRRRGERSVPEWQYWQSIWNRPAWCLWLNGIGWSGPGASGSSAAAWERQAARVGHGESNSAGISICEARDPPPCAPSARGPRTRSSRPAPRRLGARAAREQAPTARRRRRRARRQQADDEQRIESATKLGLTCARHAALPPSGDPVRSRGPHARHGDRGELLRAVRSCQTVDARVPRRPMTRGVISRKPGGVKRTRGRARARRCDDAARDRAAALAPSRAAGRVDSRSDFSR